MAHQAMRFKKLKAAILVGAGLFVSNANAAIVTLIGTNFDVVYDSSLMALFGQPTLSGNTIFFSPTNFFAESLNGVGYALTRSTINFDIIAHSNTTITSFGLTEQGDYKLKGISSEVTVGGETIVRAISDPVNKNDIQHITSVSDLSIKDGANHDWVATTFTALSAPKWQGVTSYRYTLENILDAYTDSGDVGQKLAFIEKKFSGTSIVVSTVPEADTYAMLLVGLGVMGMIARRKLV